MNNEFIEPWQKMMNEWEKTQTTMNQQMMSNMKKWQSSFENPLSNDNSFYSNNPTLDIFQSFMQKVFEHNPQYNLQSSSNWQDILNAFPGSDELKSQMNAFIKGNNAVFDQFKKDIIDTLPDDETKDYFMSTLDDISNPYSWLKFSNSNIEEGIKRFSEGPLFSGISDLDNRLAKAMDGWLELGEKNNDYYEVLLKSWMSAYEKFIDTLNTMSDDDKKSTSPKQLVELWSKIADEELMTMHRSEEFLQVQKKLIKANAEYRLQEQHVAEVICEAMHIPTRQEVDDLHKTVTELRRELRAVKSMMATASSKTTKPQTSTTTKKAGAQTSAKPATTKKADSQKTQPKKAAASKTVAKKKTSKK
ncbi:poly(R)-hydroxyalkanoic acid synthase subunit PhaE [Eionea flava]